MKIIVATDSFKGSLSSLEVAEAVDTGIKAVYPECEVVRIPVADGGEGTVEALVWATGGQIREVEVFDPLMQSCYARYGILGDQETAVIEMSAASGLPLVPKDRRNPMLTTTYGTGQLIADALGKGCTRFVLGIGGSATNDAGTGMLQALGYLFTDADGRKLARGGQILEKIANIDASARNPLLDKAEFKVACDVDNVFFGERGAAYVFAPQKGADGRMVRELDRGLRHFADVVKIKLNKDIAFVPGSGAAGGMGGGLLAFLDAHLQPGIDLVLETLHFDEILSGADLVITGEGRMDRQTAMGKAPKGITDTARKQGIPVIAITGNVENAGIINTMGISGVFSVTPGPMSLDEAMKPSAARYHISETVKQIFTFHSAITAGSGK
jgi:glycerate kinase